jgi:hypothetical protein
VRLLKATCKRMQLHHHRPNEHGCGGLSHRNLHHAGIIMIEYGHTYWSTRSIFITCFCYTSDVPEIACYTRETYLRNIAAWSASYEAHLTDIRSIYPKKKILMNQRLPPNQHNVSLIYNASEAWTN